MMGRIEQRTGEFSCLLLLSRDGFNDYNGKPANYCLLNPNEILAIIESVTGMTTYHYMPCGNG